MDLVQRYLNDLYDRRSTGATTPETSFYGPLEHLLNAIGSSLKPRVHAFMSLKEQGEGMPDGGLFLPSQLQKASPKPLQGQIPARGAIEAKSPRDGLAATIESTQVAGYLKRNGIVLATNFRQFSIVRSDKKGRPIVLESFSIADKDVEFWEMARHSARTSEQIGLRLIEFLKRAMLQAAPIATPEDVAWFLASYAREARSRIDAAKLTTLEHVRNALEQALGISFEGQKGEHFFKSTLIQTLFYGVFSSWVLWCEEHPPQDAAKFDWREAGWSLHVPMISALFDQLSAPNRLRHLNLVEVLNWTADTLNRVDRSAFFESFDKGQAVQYFYEPFLEKFDPQLRKELGVWYTPPEIVTYMVSRVDTVLREDLKIQDGLADPRVVILDPCCGTGAYLVEVLKLIALRLNGNGKDALTGELLKKAAMQRVFGFELLPAPFVVAHLQLGLLLKQNGAPLSHDSAERCGVFLTNALTGWEPPKVPKTHLLFPELEDERDAAEKVKREAPILVILGNPPYNAFAGVSPQEEAGLVEPYKKNLSVPVNKGGWGIKKSNLHELYIRFIRLAERRIAEKSDQGVVAFITNFSLLGDPSYVVMRERLLSGFDSIWIDCLNGASRGTGKTTPEGEPDPSVFSTPQNRAGIQVGTSVSLMVRTKSATHHAEVRFRHFWGKGKRADLLASLNDKNLKSRYTVTSPRKENRFSFRPEAASSRYGEWPKITDMCSGYFAGISEDRKKALISHDRDSIATRMHAYFDPDVSWDQLRDTGTLLTTDMPRFDAKKARQLVTGKEQFSEQRVTPYALRPFDLQWCYYTPIRPLWREPRPDYWNNFSPGGRSLVTRFKGSKDNEGYPVFFSRYLCDYHMMTPNASVIPFELKAETATDLFSAGGPKGNVPNLSQAAVRYLETVSGSAEQLFFHALAVSSSSRYLAENAGGVKNDFPRIPLPIGLDALRSSSALGAFVSQLHDVSAEVSGVTTGTIRPELSSMGRLSASTTPVNLELTCGWGYSAKDGKVMPGRGKIIERDYSEDEKAGIAAFAKSLALSVSSTLSALGSRTLDIYLNDSAHWSNVPLNVWEYRIGGSQVLKKWLSYREHPILGRPLSTDEASFVRNMVRRLAALCLIGPQLDENYESICSQTFEWSTVCK